MYIKKLEINNFRNISNCCIEPDSRINFICGFNAQGKTNLIESIYFSSLFKSFRTNIKTDLIKKEEHNLLINIETVNNDVNHNLKIFLDKNKIKKILIDNKDDNHPHRILNSIVYYPDEISHLKSSPSYRRNIIDRSIFFINNDYLNIFKKYLKCLKQRNFYLKNPGHRDIWREQLIEYGYEIISERITFLDRINKKLKTIEKDSQIDESYSIEYKKYRNDEIKSKLYNDFIKQEEKEKKYGYTLSGPHVDDIYFKINNININKYSSEGQKRSMLLNYKQAQLIDYKDNKGFYPILLFDDIGNELDSSRKNNIFNKILENSGQVFITTTDLPDTKGNRIYIVDNGSFTEFI